MVVLLVLLLCVGAGLGVAFGGDAVRRFASFVTGLLAGDFAPFVTALLAGDWAAFAAGTATGLATLLVSAGADRTLAFGAGGVATLGFASIAGALGAGALVADTLAGAAGAAVSYV